MENEPFWQSRRVWGASLTLAALIAINIAPAQYDVISMIGMAIGSILGITSWVAPKQFED